MTKNLLINQSIKKELTIDKDSIKDPLSDKIIIAELENLKSKNSRLEQIVNSYQAKEIENSNVEQESGQKIQRILSALNNIKLNSSKYQSIENRIITHDGKILTHNGKVLTTKVNVTDYNYLIDNIRFTLNKEIKGPKDNPFIELDVFFYLKAISKNVKEVLIGDLIYIQIQKPDGSILNNISEYTEIMPFRSNTNNHFTIIYQLNSFIKGDYFIRFYIDGKEVGEGYFQI